MRVDQNFPTLMAKVVGLSVVNCLQKLLKLFVQQSNHMKFFKVLS